MWERRLALTGWLIATACNDSIYVEVRSDRLANRDQLTDVELWVGRHHCDPSEDGLACPAGILMPTSTMRLPGDVFFRDGPESFRSPVVDGAADFVFPASDRDVTLVALG